MTGAVEPPRFAAPSHLTAMARRRLDEGRRPVRYPALGDTAGWVELIKRTDHDAATVFATLAPDLPTERRRVSGADVYVTRGVRADAVNLLFHGGGLTMFGGTIVGSIARIEAARYGTTTWAVDYRMPPAHPFPVGLDDAVSAYRRLLESTPPASIIVTGGSAGGNIATAMLLRARDAGLPMPAGLVLLSPEVDLTESGDSFTVLAEADTTLESLRIPNLLYAAGAALDDPFVSPLFGSFAGFPPTLIQSGTRDLFLSNAVRLHRKLRATGIASELHVFEAMPHCQFGGSAEDEEVSTEVASFMERVLPRSSAGD